RPTLAPAGRPEVRGAGPRVESVCESGPAITVTFRRVKRKRLKFGPIRRLTGLLLSPRLGASFPPPRARHAPPSRLACPPFRAYRRARAGRPRARVPPGRPVEHGGAREGERDGLPGDAAGHPRAVGAVPPRLRVGRARGRAGQVPHPQGEADGRLR